MMIEYLGKAVVCKWEVLSNIVKESVGNGRNVWIMPANFNWMLYMIDP